MILYRHFNPVNKTMKKSDLFLPVILFGLILSSPLFAVEINIPNDANVYNWVFRQFDQTDVTKILDNGPEEASIKTLAQNAFNRFKQDESFRFKSSVEQSILALEHLKTLVNDLYNEKQDRTSRLRIRLLERALDGVGDENAHWFG